MTKMNPEIKARWVAALRSGEYKQGKNRLRARTDSGGLAHCCLGVLCDLLDPDGWDGGNQHRDKTGMPAQSVREQAGFGRLGDYFMSPEVVIGGSRACLTDHNDHGRTFAEIADAIEAQL